MQVLDKYGRVKVALTTSATEITVGSTAVLGGTSGLFLYNNAGVLGEATISTGLTVGTTPITSGTIGRVLFQGTGNVLQQSSSLFWDNANARLGIGTSTPSNTLHLSSSALNTRINIANSNATPNTGLSFLSGSTSSWSIAAYGANMNFTFYNDFLNADALFITRATNNIGINTTTDAGFKLDVNGTARVVNNSFFATALGSANGGNGIGIGTTTLGTLDPNQRIVLLEAGLFPSYRLSAASNIGFVGLNASNNAMNIGSTTSTYLALFTNNAERMRIPTTGNVLINTTTDAGFRLDVNGTARVSGNTTVSLNQSAITSFTLSNTTNNANASVRFYLQGDSTASQVGKLSSSYASGAILKAGDYFFYNQSVGNITFWNNLSTGNINFTTGTGTSPQMTLKSSGVLNLSSLPTSSAGLSAGDLWNDGGTLKIV